MFRKYCKPYILSHRYTLTSAFNNNFYFSIGLFSLADKLYLCFYKNIKLSFIYRHNISLIKS